MATQLNNADFMTFPLQIGAEGTATSTRREHVREQIEQVLFTYPGERWFRPEFGVGVRALVFEPNNRALWEITQKRLLASLTDALAGEVDPSSLSVEATGEEEKLFVTIAYRLATINHTERMAFAVES
jgi:hypothetical protein